ncbi:MAG: EAL domain-containing protein [Acidimicrobiales bacterium]|nr:EAL domain-containing protein [Acidimicrobiales bacterium]
MSPIRVLDSTGRWVGLLACVAAAVAALGDVRPEAVAAFAVLGAVGILVADAHGRRRPGPSRGPAEVADAILDAGDLASIEAAIRAEIAAWPDVAVEWCTLTTIIPSSTRPVDRALERDLARVLARVGDRGLDPVRVALPRGDAIAVPCGASSDLVLVAAGRSLPVGIEDALADLAVLAGIASRQAALADELAGHRYASRFEKLVSFASDAIFIIDVNGRIRYASPSVTPVLGYWSVDVEGSSFVDLVVEAQRDDVGTFLGDVQLQDARHPSSVELGFRCADGTTIAGELTGSNLLANPDVRGVIVTVRDISARIRLEEQLRHQAFHDALTGLANRSLFRDRLDHAMRSRRDPTDLAPAVAFLDLDDFKYVNDSLGHGAGDEYLRVVAERVQACMRAGDTAARVGGDEFALMFEEVPGVSQLRSLVQRVVDAVSEPVMIGQDEIVHAGASAGIATSTPDVRSSEDLLRHADMAMYQAKVRGKGRVVRYEPEMQGQVSERVELTADLDAAIRNDELEVHYQPIVQLDTERVVGVEALVRWPHPARGLLEPDAFIRLAEDTGLIVPLGVAVLRRAVADLAGWQAQGVSGVRLAVNVSPREFVHPEFQAAVLGALEAYGIVPELLQIEVTEDVLAGDGTAETRMRALAGRGVHVALDDFGLGVSSLQALQRMPLDQLKIDRAFVSPLRAPHQATMARAIVEVAETIGADAVAEGIEHHDELAALRSLGCSLGQGNLFGPPSPAESVLPMLLAEQKTSAAGRL